MKKVLVCGATGFIGRNIASFLASQGFYEVTGTYFESEPYALPDVRLLRVDLRDPEAVDEIIKGKDIVIQAAAVTSGAKDILTKPFIHVTDNAVMNAYIFRSAYEHKVGHVIFFSCAIFYQSSKHPIKEEDFDANQEMHGSYFGAGWTKLYHEKMCEFYSRIGSTKYTVVRHSNIYGPFDKFDLDHSHVFGATMTKVMTAFQGEKVLIWGTGEEGRDLLYIDDLVNFVAMVIVKQNNQFELLNIGRGQLCTIKDLVQKIIKSSGKNLTIGFDTSRPTIPITVCLDTSRAQERFGWESKVSIDEGIQKTMQWYKDNINSREILNT